MNKKENRLRKHKKIRSKIFGTFLRPRLSVFKSSKYIFFQLIDDKKKVTLVSVSDKKFKTKGSTKSESSFKAGEFIAKKALEKNIKNAVFDRGGHNFTGRIKSAAEGARAGGLIL